MTTLVLGIGNLVMSDDGVGVQVLQRMQRECRFQAGVELLDGGTLGLDLLPRLEGVDHLLVVDAVETGKAPGTLVRLVDDEIPQALATKVSPHQMGLQDLLVVARLQGFAPQEMVLWGVQPESIEMGMELSDPVNSQVELLIEKTLEELKRWGISPECD